MAVLDKMSTGEKAGIVGKMSMKEIAALKIAGMERHHTTEQEHTAKMEKMTEQKKSDLFDKLPMEKRMSIMRKEHMEKTPKK